MRNFKPCRVEQGLRFACFLVHLSILTQLDSIQNFKRIKAIFIDIRSLTEFGIVIRFSFVLGLCKAFLCRCRAPCEVATAEGLPPLNTLSNSKNIKINRAS